MPPSKPEATRIGDGGKRYVTESVADGVILLGGQQGGSQDQPASGKSNNNGLVSQPRRPPRRVRLPLMLPAARRSQITTSLLIPARAVSDLTRAFFHPTFGRGGPSRPVSLSFFVNTARIAINKPATAATALTTASAPRFGGASGSPARRASSLSRGSP